MDHSDEASQRSQMPSILVTGASGFVGRAVCEQALALGMKVRVSYRSSSSLPRLTGETEKIQIPFINDVTDWSHAFAGIDVVVHLAARVHMVSDKGTQSLSLYREVNTAGTEHLARSAVASGVKRLVFVSTVKVNGEQTGYRPFEEEDPPRPEGAYAISKWESEEALNRIAAETGLGIVVLRPPLVYGQGVGANFLRLLGLIRSGIPLPLASVSNRRSLIYVKNLSDAILKCAVHSCASPRTYLVCDEQSVSTPELIEHIASLMGLRVRTFSCPPRLLNLAGELLGKSAEVARLLQSLVIDDRRIQSEIGWTPPYSLLEGLRETIDWYLATRQVNSRT